MILLRYHALFIGMPPHALVALLSHVADITRVELCKDFSTSRTFEHFYGAVFASRYVMVRSE